jgi:hypothetical protein
MNFRGVAIVEYLRRSRRRAFARLPYFRQGDGDARHRKGLVHCRLFSGLLTTGYRGYLRAGERSPRTAQWGELPTLVQKYARAFSGLPGRTVLTEDGSRTSTGAFRHVWREPSNLILRRPGPNLATAEASY